MRRSRVLRASDLCCYLGHRPIPISQFADLQPHVGVGPAALPSCSRTIFCPKTAHAWWSCEYELIAQGDGIGAVFESVT